MTTGSAFVRGAAATGDLAPDAELEEELEEAPGEELDEEPDEELDAAPDTRARAAPGEALSRPRARLETAEEAVSVASCCLFSCFIAVVACLLPCVASLAAVLSGCSAGVGGAPALSSSALLPAPAPCS